VAQQVLCNALGASGLHWAWAIDAASGPWLRFIRAYRSHSAPVPIGGLFYRPVVAAGTSSALERDGMCSG
jgi:hypothetical protein